MIIISQIQTVQKQPLMLSPILILNIFCWTILLALALVALVYFMLIWTPDGSSITNTYAMFWSVVSLKQAMHHNLWSLFCAYLKHFENIYSKKHHQIGRIRIYNEFLTAEFLTQNFAYKTFLLQYSKTRFLLIIFFSSIIYLSISQSLGIVVPILQVVARGIQK